MVLDFLVKYNLGGAQTETLSNRVDDHLATDDKLEYLYEKAKSLNFSGNPVLSV